MKKILTKIFALFSFLLIVVLGNAQNEYRYFSLKFGLVNNYVPVPEVNHYLLMRTPYGDFFQKPLNYINYTPGASFAVLFHFDAKNDHFGVVVGGQVQNYGFTVNYISDDSSFHASDKYLATALVIPIYIKYNTGSIFLNQTYFTLGIKHYINLFMVNIQNGDWTPTNYVRTLSGDEFHTQVSSLFFGFNYKIYYIDLEYQLRSLLNKDYRTTTEEGLVRPYQHINYQMKLFLTLGIHIPLNRWTTTRSWTAEKIRRLFTPVK